LLQKWAEVDHIEELIRTRQESVEELEESKCDYENVLNDVRGKLEVWGQRKRDIENGKTLVVAHSDISKKRKRLAEKMGSHKDRSRDDEEDTTDTNTDVTIEEIPNTRGSVLTLYVVKDQITELRLAKRHAHRQRAGLDAKIKSGKRDVESLVKARGEIKAEMSALCIASRNRYSKGAIQQDFAAGIKEMDQENAAEEDEENFNPEEVLRDYDEVARSLPVFCVSSRGYQKLSGRLQRDPDVPGFQSLAETEVTFDASKPQLVD
jgi:hypothetical protein